MNNIEQVISKSKKLLDANPYDEGHTFQHHEQVWTNAKKIIKHEKLAIDKIALQIACLWHDVLVNNVKDRNFIGRSSIIVDTCRYLSSLMNQLNFDQETIDKTTTAIGEHERRSIPKSLEGKVLWDADKLEWLSLKRWKKIYQSYKSGKMSKLRLFLYKKAGKIWLKTLKNRYNFESTKKIHDQKIKQLLNNKDIQLMAKEFGEDLNKVLIG